MEIRKKNSESLRRHVAKLYYRGNKSMNELGKEFGVSQAAIHSWVVRYRSEYYPDLCIKQEISTFGSLKNPEPISQMKNKNLTPEEMTQRIKELEKELEHATMRSTVLDKMIDIAERDLKISIRKKSGAKQSKK